MLLRVSFILILDDWDALGRLGRAGGMVFRKRPRRSKELPRP